MTRARAAMRATGAVLALALVTTLSGCGPRDPGSAGGDPGTTAVTVPEGTAEPSTPLAPVDPAPPTVSSSPTDVTITQDDLDELTAALAEADGTAAAVEREMSQDQEE